MKATIQRGALPLCILAISVFCQAALAQATSPNAGAKPAIDSVQIHSNTGEIVITGTNLAVGTATPKVQVDGGFLTVITVSTGQLVADFPSSLTTLGGTQLLKVTTSAGAGTFDLAVTSVGSQGPTGPQGPQGPQGAQGPTGSTGPPGTMTLPYAATLNSSNMVTDFLVNDSGYYATGIEGAGGTLGVLGRGSQSQSTGVQGAGGLGGDGVMGNGGQIDYYWQWSGPGGVFNGGGTIGDGFSGGDGVRAFPGDGIGILAYNVCTASLDYYYEVDCPPAHGSLAGYFDGYVQVIGNLSKAGGSFEIDHPVDPANKYLYHSFVESPDMMNIYNGNVVTDGSGNAQIMLPDWFCALNRDYRYQLTTVGQFAQAMVSSEIQNNQFAIKTDKPNVKVSWMVTGIRQDAWANAHRIPVEVEKAESDRGHYLHPELFDHAGDTSIPEMHHPKSGRPRRE